MLQAMWKGWIAIILLSAWTTLPDCAQAQGDFNVAQARKSVVLIKRVGTRLSATNATGFFADKDGLIYTHRQAALSDDDKEAGAFLMVGVPSAKDPDVLEFFRADVVYVAPAKDNLDFAALKITGKPGAFIPLPQSKTKPYLASPIATLGYASSKGTDDPPLSFSKGTVSATGVKLDGRAHYQVDIAAHVEGAGGPLFNAKGEVVGLIRTRKENGRHYALYLSEIDEAATQAKKLAAKTTETAALADAKTMPAIQVLRAEKFAWTINKAEVAEAKGTLTLDANGTAFWITSKSTLPRDFELAIPCHVVDLQGDLALKSSQFGDFRSLLIRFGTEETDADILDGKGYRIHFSHTALLLYKDGKLLRRVDKRVMTEPFLLTITKRGKTISIARNSEPLLSVTDESPLPGEHRFSIGGYLSRLRIGDTAVTKFAVEPVKVSIKKLVTQEKPMEVDAGEEGPRPFQKGDVTLRQFGVISKKQGDNILGDIIWARDGKSFFVLWEFGTLQRVSANSGKVEEFTELGHKCGNLAMSGEGLLVSVIGIGELWVIDPASLQDIKMKIAISGLSHVSSGIEGSLAWAGTPKANRRGHMLNAVNLKKGKVTATHAKHETWVFAASPDGKYVLCAGDDGLSRFRVEGDELTFEETSYRIGGNNTRRICFSNDSKFVAMPSGGGNGAHPDHPPLSNYSTFIYPTDNLRRPATGYAAGGYPRAVGIDPISRCIFGQNSSKPLIVYGFSADYKLSEHDFSPLGRVDVQEFAISPLGREAIARTDRNGIVHVRINKDGPPLSANPK